MYLKKLSGLLVISVVLHVLLVFLMVRRDPLLPSRFADRMALELFYEQVPLCCPRITRIDAPVQRRKTNLTLPVLPPKLTRPGRAITVECFEDAPVPDLSNLTVYVPFASASVAETLGALCPKPVHPLPVIPTQRSVFSKPVHPSTYLVIHCHVWPLGPFDFNGDMSYEPASIPW